jgi:hypothetical protein
MQNKFKKTGDKVVVQCSQGILTAIMVVRKGNRAVVSIPQEGHDLFYLVSFDNKYSDRFVITKPLKTKEEYEEQIRLLHPAQLNKVGAQASISCTDKPGKKAVATVLARKGKEGVLNLKSEDSDCDCLVAFNTENGEGFHIAKFFTDTDERDAMIQALGVGLN